MRFRHIEIFVSDLARAPRFYREVLGFEALQAQGPDFLWLRCGRPPAVTAREEEAASGIVLYTSGLARAAARLAASGLAFRGTVDSEKCLTFCDPDGNWIQQVDRENR